MKSAALVLASGLSRRFGSEDKLLADLKGQALLAYCLDAARNTGFDGLFVVCPDSDPRADLARTFGFEVIGNRAPELGQGASIAVGTRHILDKGYQAVCVLLGDMPFITAEYLMRLSETSGDIVFSQRDGVEQPPAIFRNLSMQALTGLFGDNGARTLDLSSFDVTRLNLPVEMSIDFDTEDDFKAV